MAHPANKIMQIETRLPVHPTALHYPLWLVRQHAQIFNLYFYLFYLLKVTTVVIQFFFVVLFPLSVPVKDWAALDV